MCIRDRHWRQDGLHHRHQHQALAAAGDVPHLPHGGLGRRQTERVLAQARQRLEQPTPRVALGLALRGIASSCLDVSDGLLGDLGHILDASGVGACIDANITRGLLHARRHPLMAALATTRIDACTLAGGDDYELCFTAPASAQTAVREAAQQSATPVTCIGRIEAQRGVRVIAPGGQQLPLRFAAFDHFA